MNTNRVNILVAEWDDVYKKGQLSLWILIAIFDGKKYAAQINDFMHAATNGTFEVKEQSLYRALRRFHAMKLIVITMQESPSGGPQRKYYELTPEGEEVLRRFVALNINPLLRPNVSQLVKRLQQEEKNE
jgi:PadR family transcriptional regulator PadR